MKRAAASMPPNTEETINEKPNNRSSATAIRYHNNSKKKKSQSSSKASSTGKGSFITSAFGSKKKKSKSKERLQQQQDMEENVNNDSTPNSGNSSEPSSISGATSSSSRSSPSPSPSPSSPSPLPLPLAPSMESYIPEYLRPYMAPYYGDYCYSRCFDARLLAQIMVEGFLPIATRHQGYTLLLPKLHEERCVISLQQQQQIQSQTEESSTDAAVIANNQQEEDAAAVSSTAQQAAPKNNNGKSSSTTTTRRQRQQHGNYLHTPRSVRKKAKKFYMTINQAFDAVVQGCQEQHGTHCWLYRPLVSGFRVLNNTSAIMQATVMPCTTTSSTSSSSQSQSEEPASTTTCPVRVYSIEVWSTDDETQTDDRSVLVAGELGYTIGQGNMRNSSNCTNGNNNGSVSAAAVGSGIYTSLTGFSRQDSAGSVQMAALGQWLVQAGFGLWDLGMGMQYKEQLGAISMPRQEFVRHVHELRRTPASTERAACASTSEGEPSSSSSAAAGVVPPFDTCSVRRNCRDIIDGKFSIVAPPSAITTSSKPSSDAPSTKSDVK